jgi:conjugal transfer pilus assembly protein TraL
MKEIPIPRYVDSQMQLFFWELDEVVVISAIAGFGIVMDMVFYSMIAGFFASILFTKYKNNFLDGILMHMAYWAGFMKLNKLFPNGQIRHYVP